MNEINNFDYDEDEILKTWIKFIDYYTSMCNIVKYYGYIII